MLGGNKRPDQSKCAHRETVVVLSTGVQRTVCETCGFVSFSFLNESTTEVERERFARTVDHTAEMATTGTY